MPLLTAEILLPVDEYKITVVNSQADSLSLLTIDQVRLTTQTPGQTEFFIVHSTPDAPPLTLNLIDETPPDLHVSAGMACADCHVGGDVHGDGNLYSSERYQVGIRCEDCHGTVRAEVREDAVDGHVRLRFVHADDNRVYIQTKSGAPRIFVGEPT